MKIFDQQDPDQAHAHARDELAKLMSSLTADDPISSAWLVAIVIDRHPITREKITLPGGLLATIAICSPIPDEDWLERFVSDIALVSIAGNGSMIGHAAPAITLPRAELVRRLADQGTPLDHVTGQKLQADVLELAMKGKAETGVTIRIEDARTQAVEMSIRHYRGGEYTAPDFLNLGASGRRTLLRDREACSLTDEQIHARAVLALREWHDREWLINSDPTVMNQVRRTLDDITRRSAAGKD